MQIEGAVRLDRQKRNSITMLLEEIAEFDIGRMLDAGGRDVAFLGMGNQSAMDCRVIAFGAATCENDLPLISVNQGSDPGACLLDPPGNLMSKGISAGRIAPMLGQKRKHGGHN